MRVAPRITALFLIVAPIMAAEASAQSEPTLGVTVRSEACRPLGCHRVRGVMIAQRGDSLIVRERDGSHAVIPWTAADTVEVLRGTQRYTGIGAGVGALVGLAAGGVVAGACSGLSDGSCPVAYGIGAGSGLVLGLLVGSLITSEDWAASVPQVAVHLGERPALGVRIAF